MENKLGNYVAVIVTSLIGILSLAIIVLTHSVTVVAISAFLTGFYLIALVVLMSLFVTSIVGMQQHARYWSRMTLGFAVSQFVAGYVFSYLLNFQFSYQDMFEVSLLMLVLSFMSYLFIWESQSKLLLT